MTLTERLAVLAVGVPACRSSQLWKMTKGMQEAVEDHFILKKGQKKSHPIDVAVHVQSSIGWMAGGVVKSADWMAFFRGSLLFFVVLIRLVGWIGGRGMHTHD